MHVIETVSAQDISLRVDLPVGSKIPAIASSAGKVLISRLSDLEIAKIYDSPQTKVDGGNLQSKDDFIFEIHSVREQGYAVNDGEYEICRRKQDKNNPPCYGGSGRAFCRKPKIKNAGLFFGPAIFFFALLKKRRERYIIKAVKNLYGKAVIK